MRPTAAAATNPPSCDRGLSLVEVIIAIAVFAVLLLAIDAVFSVASRAARRVDAAADVQQNGRLAVELLTREVRESSRSQIAVGGVAGAMAVVFKSARLGADASVFCTYTPTRTDPLYRIGCFYWPSAPLPPYPADPPYPAPCDTAAGEPCGTYAPIWQRAIGYYVAGPPGNRELRRTVVTLSAPDAPLPDPSTLRGGQAVAGYVEQFDAAVAGGLFTATLTAQLAVPGVGAGPPQAVVLTTAVMLRNGR